MVYEILKKATVFLGISAIVSGVACVCFYLYTVGVWSWENVEIQYVDSIHINGCTVPTNKNIPYTVNMNMLSEALDDEETREVCCFEIRNQDDWEYIKEVLKLEDDIQLDFRNYYIISLGWKMDTLKCQRVTMEQQEQTKGKSKIKPDSYQKDTIHIYRMEEKINIRIIEEE